MHKKIIGWIGICFFLFGNCVYAEEASTVPFNDIYLGQADHLDNIIVINDEEMFNELWTKHIWGIPKPPPKIDFSKLTVIAISGGGGGKTGLSFVITSIDRKPSQLLVHAKAGYVRGGRKIVQMIDIVSIPKTKLPVTLDLKIIHPHPI